MRLDDSGIDVAGEAEVIGIDDQLPDSWFTTTA